MCKFAVLYHITYNNVAFRAKASCKVDNCHGAKGGGTVAVRYYSDPKVLFNVSRGSFMPAPNVDSCVIRLDIKEKTPEGVTDEAFFFKTVRAAFSQRRKTLVNSAASGLSVDKGLVSRALEDSGLPLTVRPEQLTMEQFVLFSENLKSLI